MTATLIVSCYNNWEVTARCLAAITKQTRSPDWVVLADDGSAPPPEGVFPAGIPNLVHVWQPDDGFRKSAILNRAVFHAPTEVLVFIDSDCLPHRKFIADHLDLHLRHPGAYVQGSRSEVLADHVVRFRPTLAGTLAWAAAGRLTARIKAFRFPLPFRRFVWGGPFYPCGSNLSCWKEDFVAVNGYDEGFIDYGSEDNDFCYRLQAYGRKPVPANGCAILYHLGHPPRAHSDSNRSRLAQKLRTIQPRCEVGYEGTADRGSAQRVTIFKHGR